jgi:broad specificity phosphatase PhoE
MRVVEHRRHSHRDPAGIHLSREGVELARRLTPTIGRFDRVVTSPKPRAVETAEALGFAVDAFVPDLGGMPDDAAPALGGLDLRSFADYVRLVDRSEVAAQYARRQADRLREELERTPEGGRMLAVSHGGIVEFSAAGAVGHAASQWGALVGHLEGVRLTLDRGRWVRGEVIRIGP